MQNVWISDQSLLPIFKTKDFEKTIGISYEGLTIQILCLLMRKLTLFDESNLSIQTDTNVDKFNSKYGYTQLTCTCKCQCTSACTCQCSLYKCVHRTLYKCLCRKDCFNQFSGTINVVFTESMALKMDHESRYWIKNLAVQAQVCV